MKIYRTQRNIARGKVWNEVQSYVMQLEGEDLTSASSWSEPQIMRKSDGSPLYTEGITLDMTYFSYQKKHYVAWAQRPIDHPLYGTGSSEIYIAEYDTENISQITGTPKCISKPVYEWEYSKAPINEGLYVLEHDGRVFMTVAVNLVGKSYAVKLMELRQNGNPLEEVDWFTRDCPALSSADNSQEPGPGHNSFIKYKGEVLFIYHYGEGGAHRISTVRRIL